MTRHFILVPTLKYLIVSIFLFLFFTGHAETTDSSAYYEKKGGEFYSKGDYTTAEKYFTKALSFNSKNTSALRFRGWCYITFKEYNKALSDANTLYSIDSVSIPDVYLIRGSAKKSLDNISGALTDLNKAIKLDPNNYLGYRLRSDVYSMQKEYTKAITDLTLAIKLTSTNKNLAELYYYRANAYLSLNKLDEAYADFSKSVELNPALSYGYRGLAIIDNKNNRNDKAFTEINKAVETASELNALKISCATKIKILFDSEQYEACIKACDLYFKIDASSNAEAYKYRALSSYMFNGASDKCIQDLDKAIAINPDNYEYYHNKGVIYYNMNRCNFAVTAFTKSIALNKNYALSYAFRSLSYLKLNSYAPAQADMNAAIALDSFSTSVIVLRGDFNAATNKYEQAIQDYTYVLKQVPDYTQAYLSISKVLLNSGNYTEGLNNINTYLSKGGTVTPEVKYTRALLNLHAGNLKEAETEFDEVIPTGYETGMCYLYCGICHKSEKSYSKALWYFQNAEKHDLGSSAPVLYESKAQVLEELENYQGATVEYTKLINAVPEYGEAYLSRGKMQMEQKKYAAAVTDFRSAIKKINAKSVAYEESVNMLALACIFNDSPDEALAAITNVTFSNSDTRLMAGIMKIILLTAKKEYKKSLDACSELLKSDASNPVLLRYRGLLALALQDYSKAADDFIHIAELYPNEPDAYSIMWSGESAHNVPYKDAAINNLVLYKDTSSNTINIGFMLDKAHQAELLNKLNETFNAKALSTNKKYICNLLLAECRKSLSENTDQILAGYDQAIAENPNAGIGYYLRGMYKKDYLKDTAQACIDIQKAKSLGITIPTDICVK